MSGLIVVFLWFDTHDVAQNVTTAWLLGGTNIVLSVSRIRSSMCYFSLKFCLQGGGVIDGNGLVWWEAYATNPDAGVAGGSSLTFARPIPLTIYQGTVRASIN
jgi:galacturan 1,4-alpha-galacturonidase